MKEYFLYKNKKYCIRDDYVNNEYLKKYNKKDLLDSFYNISKDIYKLNKKKNFLNMNYKFYVFDNREEYKISHLKMLLPSQLVRLSYYSLIYGNNKIITNNKKIENDKNILGLLDNNLCGDINILKRDNIAMLHSMGQDQFWCQCINNEIYNFSRNYEILEYIQCGNKDKIFNDVLGMTYNDFNKAMLELLVMYIHIDNQNEVFDKIINYDKNSYKLIQYYTFNLDTDKHMGYQGLLYKPFIKINNKYILTNIYSLFKCFSNSAYWVIRNYYCKQGDGSFITEFGNKAEIYIHKLLDTYLNNKYVYNKIKEKKSKTCDWAIETNKYILLIEQKTYLENLKSKNIDIDIKKFREDIKKYKTAIEQLNTTEKNDYNCSPKKVIKIILHYDEFYFQSSILGTLKDEKDYDINNMIMLNMDEFERIIYCLSCDEEKFNHIIEEILYGYNNYNGKDIEIILREQKIKNDYCKNIKNNFDKIKNDIIKIGF